MIDLLFNLLIHFSHTDVRRSTYNQLDVLIMKGLTMNFRFHLELFYCGLSSNSRTRTLPFTAIIEFARAFFVGCDLNILPILDFTPEMKCRTNSDGILQYYTDGFYDYLTQTRSRRDSTRELLCVALTMADIYTGKNWNFIYWQVDTRSDLGVLSFARADPLFPASQLELCEEPVTEDHRIKSLRRCVKLLSAVGRLFGLNNCIYYNCFMNNANHDEELDRKPLYLCPICLRKLYSTLKFDIRLMYETLANLCEKYGLQEECAWYRKRLNFMRDEQMPT